MVPMDLKTIVFWFVGGEPRVRIGLVIMSLAGVLQRCMPGAVTVYLVSALRGQEHKKKRGEEAGNTDPDDCPHQARLSHDLGRKPKGRGESFHA